MNIVKIAAFSDEQAGGNPAGIVLNKVMPTAADMQRIATEVGFSETAFAEIQGDVKNWRVRYFSPESEVPFCGHATIALGAVLAKQYGDGRYQLTLNEANISVEGMVNDGQYSAALQSPVTHFELLSSSEIEDTLALFSYRRDQLSDAIAPARIHGGADHYLLVLKTRADLAAMTYDLNQGRRFMQARNLVTIMLVVAESDQLFHVRNAFASGGVLEDPATGAAAAAFSGYLRDIEWTSKRSITIIQGEDIGHRSIITSEFGTEAGSSIRVSGTTRALG